MLANTFGANNLDRIANTATITTNGTAGLSFTHNGSVVSYSETVGTVTLGTGTTGGALSLVTSQADVNQTSDFTIGNLVRNTGATVNFSGAGLGLDGRNRVVLTQVAGLAPTANQFLGGWAVAGDEFAKYDTTVGSVTALVAADYTTNPAVEATGWVSGANIKLTGAAAAGVGTALTANRSVKSLNLASAGATTLDLGATTLRLESGGLLMSGAIRQRDSRLGDAHRRHNGRLHGRADHSSEFGDQRSDDFRRHR